MPCLEDMTASLCRDIVQCDRHRTDGPTRGYRNKITYSLQPSLVTCDLAEPAVNAACQQIASFRTDRSAFPEIWCEVCAKRTRKGDFMIKVSFVSTDDVFSDWLRQEGRGPFCDFVREKIPPCVALVAHAASSSASVAAKPSKKDQYVSLLGDGSVEEYTPNGYGFLLSADSFCEVNHTMEDAMFVAAVRMLKLDDRSLLSLPREGVASNRSELQVQRGAFMTGRDVNCVHKSFARYYAGPVMAVTTCPRVQEDTKLNGINCELSTKDRIGPDHVIPKILLNPRSAPREREGSQELPSPNPLLHFDFFVTAGRHGLHRQTVESLNESSKFISSLLYVSCNVESMTRDIHLLKCCFSIRDAATFDFFPGTDYVMTMLVLTPLKAPRSLLVLPVGPPAIGKSSSCRYFQSAAMASDRQCCDKVKAAQHKLRTQRGYASSVVRDMPRIPGQISVSIFERDAAFHRHKEEGCSLRMAKEKTHCDLHEAVSHTPESMEAGEEPLKSVHKTAKVLFLDSTNGSAEARELYGQWWPRDGSDLVQVLVLHMELPDESCLSGPSSVADALCHRASQRLGHPAFPEAADAQRRKVQDVLDALGTLAPAGSSGHDSNSAFPHSSNFVLKNGETVEETAKQFGLHVFYALYCEPELVFRLLPHAPQTKPLTGTEATDLKRHRSPTASPSR